MQIIRHIRTAILLLTCATGTIIFAAEKPKQEALVALDQAITFGQMGAKWMVNPQKYNATFSAMADYYGYYTQYKEKAAEIDPQALELRKAEIKQCEDGFVTPFLALKKRLADEKAMQKVAAEAVQQAEEVKRQREAAAEREQELAREKAETERKTAIAKSKGFDAPAEGIAKLIEKLKSGRLTIAQAKTLLVFKSSSDNFKVTSTNEQHAFYLLQAPSAEMFPDREPVHIAVEKMPSAFYGNGSRLNQRIFSVVGVGTFANALGIGTDVVILKVVPE